MARADLQACVQYIAKNNPDAAANLANRVFALVNRLAAGDFDGPERRLREWPVGTKLARSASATLLPASSQRASNRAPLPPLATTDCALTGIRSVWSPPLLTCYPCLVCTLWCSARTWVAKFCQDIGDPFSGARRRWSVGGCH